jgi:hypothetical protein
MSFGLNMYDCGVSKIDSHAEALAFYNSCRVKRGNIDTDPRPIRGKERSPMDIRVKHGNVIFRYHRTDVVTWRPDDSYTVQCWASQSTAMFASCFIPWKLDSFNLSTVLRVRDTLYPVVDRITVHADGRVDTTAVFSRQVINRANAKQALASTRYADYVAWYKLMWPMVRGSRHNPYQFASVRYYYVKDVLADDANWHNLMMGPNGRPDEIRNALYTALDHEFAVYDTVQEASLPYRSNLKPWSVERESV